MFECPPHSFGGFLEKRSVDFSGSYLQHTTSTGNKHPFPQRDSNLQSQQSSGYRPTPQTARPPRYFRPVTFCNIAPAIPVELLRVPL
jgi:hypothetical protein